MYPFPNFETVCYSMSGSKCCFLTCIQVSQEAGKMVLDSHLFKNFVMCICWGFPDGSVVKKNPSANVGDAGSNPGSERSLGEGNGSQLQYSLLGNPTDRGDWWATVHGIARGLNTT